MVVAKNTNTVLTEVTVRSCSLQLSVHLLIPDVHSLTQSPELAAQQSNRRQRRVKKQRVATFNLYLRFRAFVMRYC